MENQMVFQRYELKYLLTLPQQEAVLRAMAPHVTQDFHSHSSIRNLYLDTPDFRLIRRSLEKPVYKEKLRIRCYGRSAPADPVFVELKKKYRSVVYKRRLILPQSDALRCIDGTLPWPKTQIGGEIAYAAGFYSGLRPALFLSYERDAFHGVEDVQFRITFDSQIRFRLNSLTLCSGTGGISILPPDRVLMELKTCGSLPLWMVRVLSSQGLFKTSFSKYGAAYQFITTARQEGTFHYA